jgi:hypothetical protein
MNLRVGTMFWYRRNDGPNELWMACDKVSERPACQYPIVTAFLTVRWSDALYRIESPGVVVQSTSNCRDKWVQVAIPADAGYFLENEIHSLCSGKIQRQTL